MDEYQIRAHQPTTYTLADRDNLEKGVKLLLASLIVGILILLLLVVGLLSAVKAADETVDAARVTTAKMEHRYRVIESHLRDIERHTSRIPARW